MSRRSERKLRVNHMSDPIDRALAEGHRRFRVLAYQLLALAALLGLIKFCARAIGRVLGWLP